MPANSPSQLPVYLLTHEFHPSKGGIATFVEELARGSAAIGHDVEVWAPRGDTQHDQQFPFSVRRIDLKGSHDLSCQVAMARRIIRQHKKLKNGILHLCEPGPILAMSYLQFFERFMPRKLVITFHGSEILRFAANPFRKFLVNQLIQRADRLTVLSEYTQNLLEEKFPNSRNKTLLTPGALRENFVAHHRDRSTPHTTVNILSVGRIHPRKGQLLLIEALNKLSLELQSRIHLRIVGTGNKHGYGDRLRHAAKKSAFPVDLCGEVTRQELQDLYTEADLFALTSTPHKHSVEGFGLVYLEAAAHGLPVIAHKTGGVSCAVNDKVNGLLADPKHPEQLTAAFERLISDPQLRDTMGKNGRQHATRSNWTQAAKAHFENWNLD